MNGYIIFWFIVSYLVSGLISIITIPDLPTITYQNIGDVNIGVVIPVHHYSATGFCSSSVRDLGALQRIEAISQAIKEVNNDGFILPNTKLGFIMLDDCYKDITALAQSLHFVQERKSNTCFSDDPELVCDTKAILPYDVIGVLGSESSITTIQIANLLTSFRIPLISYRATAVSLGDKNKYSNFQRTVTSDTDQAKVVIQLLNYFNWSYVSVVYNEGHYGEGAFEALDEQATMYDICFAKKYKIKNTWTKTQYQQMVFELAQEIYARIVVVLTTLTEAKMILEAIKSMQLDGRMTWIATDGWLSSMEEVYNHEYNTLGSFSVKVQSKNVPRFDTYFDSLTPYAQDVNPWICEFWETYHNCTIDVNKLDSFEFCETNKTFTQLPHYAAERTTALVYDAVYTYAHALHKALYHPDCAFFSRCNKLKCIDNVLRPLLDNISFIGEAGRVRFNKNGYVERHFTIYNVQNETGGYHLEKIGRWNKHLERLNIFKGKEAFIQWAPYNGSKPVSLCSSACAKGEEQVLRQKRCCWSCEPCESNQVTYLSNGVTRCSTCEEGTWPDEETRTICEQIVSLWLRWSDIGGIIILLVCSIAEAVTLAALILYTRNISNPLIKASSRELTYMMFFGILSSYAFVIAFLLQPSSSVCLARLLNISIIFTLLYTPLMTKTMRIYRIFEAGKKMIRRPPCVSARWQVFIVAAIVILHGIIIMALALIDAPKAEVIYTGPGVLEEVCVFPYAGFIASLCYNLFIIVVSAFFAFKARKLPDNYNESRFIIFCVYSTIIIWITFIPAYYVVDNALLECVLLGLIVIANATLILLCIIIPKLYAVYFVQTSNQHISSKLKHRQGTLRLSDEISATLNDTYSKTQQSDKRSSVSESVDMPDNSFMLNKIANTRNENGTFHEICYGHNSDKNMVKCVGKDGTDKNVDTELVRRKTGAHGGASVNPSCGDNIYCDDRQLDSLVNTDLKRTKYIHVESAPTIFITENTTEYV